jgi:hypothetical protein
MVVVDPDINTLRSILLDLQLRGHRLRHPEMKRENQTASSDTPLAGRTDEAASEMMEVRNESDPHHA